MAVNLDKLRVQDASKAWKGYKSLFKKEISKIPASALVLAVFFLALVSGSAQAQTLGDIMCNVVTNAKPFSKAFVWTGYVIAAVMAVQGINQFRAHSESPHNNPLSKAIMLWVGATLLLAAPGVISTVILTVFPSAGNGGGLTCGAGAVAAAGGGGLDTMMSGFITNIKQPLVSLVSVISILCGLYMIIHGMVKAGKYGYDPRANSMHSIVANMAFGALLMALGDNLTMMLSSVFGSSTLTSPSVISWSFLNGVSGSDQFKTAVSACLTFIQLIGLIAFVRGWLVMKKVVEGGGNVTMAQGITHILGGVLAINIVAFLQVMDRTFGTGLMQ